MTALELVAGQTYFMVTYPERSLTVPIVFSYRYLGKLQVAINDMTLSAGTATHTYGRSRELDGSQHLDVPLTPRHSVGLIGIWESENAGRLGLEWYYTGQQRLEANPYRQASRPYMLFGALAAGATTADLDASRARWCAISRPAQTAPTNWRGRPS